MKKFQIITCAIIALLFTIQVKAQSNTSKDAILSAYFDVKNALVSGNATTAGTKAKELLAALTSFTASQLTAADKGTWLKYTDKLQYDARHISENSDLAHQREHFGSLSQNMYAVTKSIKLNTAPVYHDYCPMKKLYWLSEYAAIKNPYYGNQMLTCGEVKDTLPATK